jgi:hypothetical protein
MELLVCFAVCLNHDFFDLNDLPDSRRYLRMLLGRTSIKGCQPLKGWQPYPEALLFKMSYCGKILHFIISNTFGFAFQLLTLNIKYLAISCRS